VDRAHWPDEPRLQFRAGAEGSVADHTLMWEADAHT